MENYYGSERNLRSEVLPLFQTALRTVRTVRNTISTLIPHVAPVITHGIIWSPKGQSARVCQLKKAWVKNVHIWLTNGLKNHACFTHRSYKLARLPRATLAQLLHLQQQLDPLYGGDRCFGDGSCNATGQKVFHKTNHGVRHGCAKCRVSRAVPNFTKLLKETQRSFKWTNHPPCVLIYGIHASREFLVMDLQFVKQINEAG